MRVLTTFKDERINCLNLFMIGSFSEYLEFAHRIISNNEFQRKRVKTSKTVYSLLKNDLKKGCLMPPLVLATADELPRELYNDDEALREYFVVNSEKIQILDGLQRTYTLLDAANELYNEDKESFERFLKYPIRMELYSGINKFGILYRMLTLNTGQTPMSARHQLEMLYNDMLNVVVDGITLVPDTRGKADPDDNQFVFQNTIDGFNSFLNRTELPIDRQELLENIKMLEKMSEEDIRNDLFKEYLESYIKVFKSIKTITDNYVISDEDLVDYDIDANPFGKKASKIFSTSQALTGFGAAIGKLKDNKKINSFSNIEGYSIDLEKNNSGHEWMLDMLKNLDIIRNTSKKIGNAQRMYFQYFFRELFNKDGDSFLDLEKAVSNGYEKYYSQVG